MRAANDWAILFLERVFRTIKEAKPRRLAQRAWRRGQWHLLPSDILVRIKTTVHTGTGVTPYKAYSDPTKQIKAWESMKARAEATAEPRAIVHAGDRAKIRPKPEESRTRSLKVWLCL